MSEKDQLIEESNQDEEEEDEEGGSEPRSKSKGNRSKKNDPETARHKFDTRWTLIVLSSVMDIILFVFLLSSITYGTSCPEHLSNPISMHWVNNDTTSWNVTSLRCFNPGSWFNPSTSYKRKSPDSYFLGLFMMPPGMTMVLGAIYAVVLIFIYSYYGVYGMYLTRTDMKNSLKYYSLFIIILESIIVAFNLVAWSFTLHMDSLVTPNLCQQLADAYFSVCDYVFGQFLLSIAILLFSIFIWRKASDKFDNNNNSNNI